MCLSEHRVHLAVIRCVRWRRGRWRRGSGFRPCLFELLSGVLGSALGGLLSETLCSSVSSKLVKHEKSLDSVYL